MRTVLQRTIKTQCKTETDKIEQNNQVETFTEAGKQEEKQLASSMHIKWATRNGEPVDCNISGQLGPRHRTSKWYTQGVLSEAYCVRKENPYRSIKERENRRNYKKRWVDDTAAQERTVKQPEEPTTYHKWYLQDDA